MTWTVSEDNEPFFYLGGKPINSTLLLIGLHVCMFVALALAFFFNSTGWILLLGFSSQEVLESHRYWQLFTYPFLHELNFFFILDMLMLYWFGSEMEQAYGRSRFLIFYAALTLIPALILTSIGFWHPTTLIGSGFVHFAIFIGFATLTPDALVLFNFKAKNVALTFLAVGTLIYLAQRQIDSLIALYSSVTLAWACVRWSRDGYLFSWLANWNQKRKMNSHTKKVRRVEQKKIESEKSIDSILEKISKTGLNSLTSDERKTLEKARSELIKRDQNH